MTSYEAETVLADLRQEYAEHELDQDRNPTEDGFVQWLAVRAARRPAPESAMAEVTAAGQQLAALRAGAQAAGIDLTGLPVEQAARLGSLHGDLLAERDQLRERLAAAHDALTHITEADDDVFTTLESTVEYVVTTYRQMDRDLGAAAYEIERLRAQIERTKPVLAAAEAWRAMCDDAHHDDPRGVEDRLAEAVDAFQKGRTGE